MSSESVAVRVADNGRLSLPTKQRRLIGLEKGKMVVVTVEEKEIRTKPARAVVEHLQSSLSGCITGNGEKVDEFIDERKADHDKETNG